MTTSKISGPTTSPTAGPTAGDRRGSAIQAIVVAAGLSSRMGQFKPLLELGGQSLVSRVVDTLRAGGAEQIVIVTGHQAQAIEQNLASRSGLTFVHNPDYARTSMFDSIRLGWQALSPVAGCGPAGCLLVPADIPLFKAETVRCLVRAMADDAAQAGSLVWQPVYRQCPGHPVLLSRSLNDDLLADSGSDGLRGFFSRLEQRSGSLAVSLAAPGGNSPPGHGLSPVRRVAVPDPGILFDADTPADYDWLRQAWQTRACPDIAQCLAILRHYHAPQLIIRHGKATARQAVQIVRHAAPSLHLDHRLIRAAALLHDVARTAGNHAAVGAGWLRDWDFPQIAAIIAVHMDLPATDPLPIDAAAIVYLADKQMMGECLVGLAGRYQVMQARLAGNPPARQAARHRLERARQIEQAIAAGRQTADSLDHEG